MSNFGTDPLAIAAIKGFATDADVRASTIFGMSMMDLEKEDIVRVAIFVYKNGLMASAKGRREGEEMTNQQALNRLAGDVYELYGNIAEKHPDLYKSERKKSEDALERIRKALGLKEWK